MSSKQFEQIILDDLHALLRQMGFRKNRRAFVQSTSDITHVISLQRSDASTPSELKATLNVGVYSTKLAAMLGNSPSTASVWDCHWRKRIGCYTPRGCDTWWKVCTESDAHAAAAEVRALLETRCLMELLGISSTEDLIEVWKQGESPGIGPSLRWKYLHILGIDSPEAFPDPGDVRSDIEEALSGITVPYVRLAAPTDEDAVEFLSRMMQPRLGGQDG